MFYRHIPALLIIVLGMISLPATAAENYSGFIDNYPELRADPDRPGASLYEKPGFDRSAYGKVMFSPITIFMHPESEYQGLDPDQISALSTGFIDILIEELEPDIPVVDKPGKGVLVARIAITNLRAKKKDRVVFSLIPGLSIRAGQKSAGKNLKLNDAVLEIEVLDGETGERLAVLVDSQALADKKGNAEQSWAGIESSLKFYAKRFKARLESKK